MAKRASNKSNSSKSTSSKPRGRSRIRVVDDDTAATATSEDEDPDETEDTETEAEETTDEETTDDESVTDDGEDDDGEDDDGEDEDGEDDDGEDEDGEDEDAAPKASAKSKAKPESKAKAESQGDEEEFEVDLNHAPTLIEVGKIKPNKNRPINEEKVRQIAKSIKSNGLFNPILVDGSYRIIAGNHRHAAYVQLGRKEIPVRFLMDENGQPLSTDDSATVRASIAENIHRSDLTPLEQGNAFRQYMAKTNGDAAEIARDLNVSASTVSRYLEISDGATKAMKEALSAGTITVLAAHKILKKCDGDNARIDSMLAQLLAASEGKAIKPDDVERAAPSAGRKAGESKRGRKPTRRALNAEALATQQTGMMGTLRAMPDGGWLIQLTIDIPFSGKDFTKFDLGKRVTDLAQHLVRADVITELEAARHAIQGQ